MKLELYHYVHCPFCVRVRMAAGFLGISYKSNVVPYDDEKTPIDLIGKKMLPVMVKDGVAHPESLDIIRILDTTNKLQSDLPLSPELQTLLGKVGELVHNLAMPYWVWTPEFDDESRIYYIKKKSIKRGPFELLVKRRQEFEKPLLTLLKNNEDAIKQFWGGQRSVTISDISLAAHLWGLYVVPEFRFPEAWHDFLQRVKHDCRFDYHADYWRTP